MSETVKLQSVEKKNATCYATCEVPEKYVASLIASGKWERIPPEASEVSQADSGSQTVSQTVHQGTPKV